MRADPRARARAGITLTEILISIMIMGIGLLSLATLFPIGLMRIREATRASRSALLVESARSELATRNLLSQVPNWYFHNPFRQDVVPQNNGPPIPVLDHTYGKGLPVAYDPLWWAEFGATSGWDIDSGRKPTNTSYCRFGNGLGYLRNDPTDNGTPSTHGLQRLTSFPYPMVDAIYAQVERIFASTDDIVYQTDGPQRPEEGIGSPVVPDMSTGGQMVDLSFTWMFTGRQADVTNGSVFEGDIVVFHNRLFAVESVVPPFSDDAAEYAQGERVVEAIFGYGGRPVNGYSSVRNTVLLRWPASLPDPEVRVGGWIADVTYERDGTVERSRFLMQGGNYPAQRCYWYRVSRRSEPANENDTGYRQMVITLTTPVGARTYYDGNGVPQINAALVSPYVVNVVPTIVHSR